jgi:RDD family
VDPTNGYTARFATPWRRATAAAIDWTLCLVAFLVISIPLGTIQAVGAVSWREGDVSGLPGHVLFIAAQVLTAAPAIAYFTVLLPTSQTLGMRARGLHTVYTRTGRAPFYVASFVRGVTATLFAAAVYAVFLVSTSFDSPRHIDSTSRLALHVAYVLASVAGLSALVMSLTPTHRSAADRLFGTVTLDELEAVNPVMGPWGPLDAFDLSNARLATRRDAGVVPSGAAARIAGRERPPVS